MEHRARSTVLIASVLTNMVLVGLLFTRYPSAFHARFMAPDAEARYSLESFGFHYLPETNEPKVAVIGDSIVRDANLNDLLKRGDVTNRGIAGDRSVWMLKRIKFLLARKPNFVVIQGGINDILGKVPIREIFDSKIGMVMFCKDNGVNPILMGVLPVTQNPQVGLPVDPETVNLNVWQLNLMLEEYAAKNNVPYIHMTKGLTSGVHLVNGLSRDGIHLNRQGYAVFARNIQETFEALGI